MTFADRLMEAAHPIWQKLYAHPFVQGMIDGTLEREKFLHYLVQDAQYLVGFSQVYAHAFTKTTNLALMRHIYADMSLIMYGETVMHIAYLKEMGWSEDAAMQAPHHANNDDYVHYMIRHARDGTFEEGIVAVMACALSYYRIGCYAREEAKRRGTLETSYFRGWIDAYSGEDYKKVYDSSYRLCNTACQTLSLDREDRLTKIFLRCSEFELGFWDMAFEPTDLKILT